MDIYCPNCGITLYPDQKDMTGVMQCNACGALFESEASSAGDSTGSDAVIDVYAEPVVSDIGEEAEEMPRSYTHYRHDSQTQEVRRPVEQVIIRQQVLVRDNPGNGCCGCGCLLLVLAMMLFLFGCAAVVGL